MDPYQLFLRFESAEILRKLRLSQRIEIFSFIDSLKTRPDSQGDYSETDETGREVEIKIVGGYAITYWPDHAVKEVKVADVRRADRP